MADAADMAQEIEQEHLSRGIAAARAIVVVAGAPGNSRVCGLHRSRLVGGRCAPCREPRIPRRR